MQFCFFGAHAFRVAKRIARKSLQPIPGEWINVKIACLDDDAAELENTAKLCREHSAVASVKSFSNKMQLFKSLKAEEFDIVFSETVIDSSPLYGIVSEIKSISPRTEVAFLTRHPDFALAAFEAEAMSYHMKPCTGEIIQKTLCRYLKFYPECEKKKVHVRTFGRFDVFSRGKIIHFSNKKSKELLALLIDRFGGSIRMEQVIDTLWEDRAYDESTKALYRIALKNLRDTLDKYGCRDILIESRGERSIDTEKIDCDYYNFTLNPEKYSGLFTGEYMLDYTWGEYTLARIVRIAEDNLKILPY